MDISEEYKKAEEIVKKNISDKKDYPYVRKFGSAIPEPHVYFRHIKSGEIIGISLRSLAKEWPQAVLYGKDYTLCSMVEMEKIGDSAEDYFLMNNIWRIFFDATEDDWDE